MSPRRIALLVLLAIAVLLAVNSVLMERDTEPAEADIGRILELPAGDVQVREDGPRSGSPLVLVHGFQASIRWWDRVTPALARRHRVIRIDLLGHGGSEKPRDGYSMEEQGDLVAQVMERLGVRRAAVVGHSMGGHVITALAQRHRPLVERLMIVDMAPEKRFLKGRFTQRLLTVPLVGHAISRLAPDSAVRREVNRAFEDDDDVPDELYDDPERATYNSFRDSFKQSRSYLDDEALDERLTGTGIPVDVVFGSEDELVDPKGARAWEGLRGARIQILSGSGHTPMIDRPTEMAQLILAFANPPG